MLLRDHFPFLFLLPITTWFEGTVERQVLGLFSHSCRREKRTETPFPAFLLWLCFTLGLLCCTTGLSWNLSMQTPGRSKFDEEDTSK